MEPAPMEASNAPLKRLPKRVASLAPINDLQIARQPCPELEEICSPRPEIHDKVYITDDETVYQWATKKLFLFRIFKLLYWMFRWLFDGNSFSPTWYSVLRVDDIVKKERPIFIKDTLVLNCQSIESFERLIPHICGDFSRLMIHGGDINLNQLKRLLLPSVRKVVITANIRLLPHEYDEAVRLIMGHVRGFRYNFKLESTPELITAVKAAVGNTRYLGAKTSSDPEGINVMHWTRDWLTLVLVTLQMHNSMRCLVRSISCKWSSEKSTPSVSYRSCDPAELGGCQPFPVPKSEDDYFGWCLFFASVGFFILLVVLGRAANKSKPGD
uniref:Recep_L_domain domain-containing protein n=1 Tax=Panagrellus redivivus TaxID=6233 RepID=A0A7E4ZR55_PANRE